ncbi:hypothetical protein [Bradyrhizobium sp. AUGA SZCCT0182]|uniref:hypothetical protein n=1 Tax=Bradyrhizobium sp. AUGA SZCCT0182 TaxID=2807667 RepID=UPI001BA8D209|nr:hypothetical protein [Bradyrhizobium sp. AUGA SZCCT0182]MBR1235194.1 hypothetical protein [Bradyrhizobium sp. AUGA SZCCT0182]
MKWFLIAYLSSGATVAVSPPFEKQWCEWSRSSEETYYELLLPATDYAFFCEQHKKRPKLTAKVDRDLQTKLNDTCYGWGKACGMERDFRETDKRLGLPSGTSSRRYWKARER